LIPGSPLPTFIESIQLLPENKLMENWNPDHIAKVETGQEPGNGRCILVVSAEGVVSVDRFFTHRRETFEGEISGPDLEDFIVLLKTCNPDEELYPDPGLKLDDATCHLSYMQSGRVISYQLNKDDAMLRPCFRQILKACRDMASRVSGGLVHF
jgi:hypothetical protein